MGPSKSLGQKEKGSKVKRAVWEQVEVPDWKALQDLGERGLQAPKEGKPCVDQKVQYAGSMELAIICLYIQVI